MTRARLEVVLAAVLFGTTGTALALGPDSASPLGVGAARIVVGGALLAALAAATGALRGRWSVGLVLTATAGVALLTFSGVEGATVNEEGVGLALVAGAGYATYTVIAKRLIRSGHPPV